MEESLLDIKRCQDETEGIQDASAFIQDSPIIIIENSSRTVRDGENLDQLENGKSNSCDENLSCIKDDREDDIEHDQQSSTSTDVAVNNKCGKSYTCPVCWRRFTTSSNLKRPQVTHTGERNFFWGS